MGKLKTNAVVLAIAPVSRGLGYAIFEDPQTIIDWGVKQARINKETTCKSHLKSLITFYQPDALVLEKFDEKTNRERVATLNDKLSLLACDIGLDVERLHKDALKGVFSQFGSSTKIGMAKTITEWLPELKTKMPRYRRPWMNEDHSMAMFEAVALALTYYYIHT